MYSGGGDDSGEFGLEIRFSIMGSHQADWRYTDM